MDSSIMWNEHNLNSTEKNLLKLIHMSKDKKCITILNDKTQEK